MTDLSRISMLEKERDALAEKYCRLETAAMLALMVLEKQQYPDQRSNAVESLTKALT